MKFGHKTYCCVLSLTAQLNSFCCNFSSCVECCEVFAMDKASFTEHLLAVLCL